MRQMVKTGLSFVLILVRWALTGDWTCVRIEADLKSEVVVVLSGNGLLLVV